MPAPARLLHELVDACRVLQRRRRRRRAASRRRRGRTRACAGGRLPPSSDIPFLAVHDNTLFSASSSGPVAASGRRRPLTAEDLDAAGQDPGPGRGRLGIHGVGVTVSRMVTFGGVCVLLIRCLPRTLSWPSARAGYGPAHPILRTRRGERRREATAAAGMPASPTAACATPRLSCTGRAGRARAGGRAQN